MSFFLFLALAVLVTEALVQLIVKSEIFEPVRDLVVKIPYFGRAVLCGYCTSFWVAGGGAGLTMLMPTPLDEYFLGIGVVKFLFFTLLIQRLSNFVHNTSDRWFDKYYK